MVGKVVVRLDSHSGVSDMPVCGLGNDGSRSASDSNNARCCHAVCTDSCPVAVMDTDNILIGRCPGYRLVGGVQRIESNGELCAAVRCSESGRRRIHGNFAFFNGRRSHILLDSHFSICGRKNRTAGLEADIVLAWCQIGNKAVFDIRVCRKAFLAVLAGRQIVNCDCTVILCTDATVLHHKFLSFRCRVLTDLDSLFIGIQRCSAVSEGFYKNLSGNA